MLTAARRAALAVLFATGLALALLVSPASAASPSLGSGIGDTRSSGQGAGFAGQPILVAVGVVALGLATAGVTTLYVRASRKR